MQNFSYKKQLLLLGIILLILSAFSTACTSGEYPMKDARLIVMDAADLLLMDKDKRFLYHESIPKEQLEDYLVLPITYEYLTQYFGIHPTNYILNRADRLAMAG